MSDMCRLELHDQSWPVGWIVARITLGSVLASIVVAEVLVWLMGFRPEPVHYVFAVGVPALVTPLWAVPLVRTSRRLAGLKSEMEHLAKTDCLSGLPNRRAFFAHATSLFAERPPKRMAVLMIDIDRFKHINDAWGHNVGDDAVQLVANRIRRLVATDRASRSSMVARLGGDEFVVLLEDVDRKTAGEIAEGICEVARELGTISNGRLFTTTVSVGVAVRDDGENFETIMKAADDAVYRAKRQGGDGWATATDETPAAVAAPVAFAGSRAYSNVSRISHIA